MKPPSSDGVITASGSFGAVVSCPSITFLVPGPTMPSTSRPFAFWYALIFSTVPVPILPSTAAPTTFCTQAWSSQPRFA